MKVSVASQARSILQAPQSILVALMDRHTQADGNTGRNSRKVIGVSTHQHPLSLGSRVQIIDAPIWALCRRAGYQHTHRPVRFYELVDFNRRRLYLLQR